MVASRHLHRLTLVGILGALLVALLATAALATSTATSEEAFVERINTERTERGLSPLAVDVQLTRVARSWTEQMAADGAISHRPDLATAVQGSWTRLGENVGRSKVPGASAEQLVDRLHAAFMDSAGHRDNVLGDWNFVGVGVRMTAGGEEMWVTVNFARASWPSAASQVDEAVRITRELFADAGTGGHEAQHAVVARAEVFADALGGSPLAADRAPILFTPGPADIDPNPVLHPGTRAEIDRVLGGRGTVYLLGGTAAVSDRTANELRADGYTVVRLGGATRVETSVRVAEEVLRLYGASSEVLLARSDVWADGIAGGAYAARHRVPVVVTPSGSLHPEVARFLDRHGFDQRWALGGEAALAASTVQAAGAERVAGSDRNATAVAVAERLWGRTVAGDGDTYVSAPGRGDVAWAHALALVPFAAAYDAPLLLVGDDVPESVRSYLSGLGYGPAQPAQVFTSSSVSTTVEGSLSELLGSF